MTSARYPSREVVLGFYKTIGLSFKNQANASDVLLLRPLTDQGKPVMDTTPPVEVSLKWCITGPHRCVVGLGFNKGGTPCLVALTDNHEENHRFGGLKQKLNSSLCGFAITFDSPVLDSSNHSSSWVPVSIWLLCVNNQKG